MSCGVVSPYGVFVIETRNMDGWIFGSEKQPVWTQKFPRKSFREVLLSDEEFYRVFEAIYVSAEPATRETRRRHVEGVRARVGRRK
jgi:hypothetical protein